MGLSLQELRMKKLKESWMKIQKEKEKKVDADKIKNFFKSMPDDRWSISLLNDRADELNSVFGISDNEVTKHCVTEVNKLDLNLIKWDLEKMSLQESAKFASEYYDAFKYNQNENLSINKIKLLNELMLTFKYIKENSNIIYSKFETRKYSDSAVSKFRIMSLPLVLLWLRILHVMFRVQSVKDTDIVKFVRLLSMERISISYQKIHKKM